jgi:Major Facilitator Superfamily
LRTCSDSVPDDTLLATLMLQSATPTATAPSSGAKARFFTLFYTLSSLAEGGQMAVLLWLTYALTSNAFLVSLMVVLGYLPSAIVGLVFKRLADQGRADRMARSTNSVLSVTSLLLAGQQLVWGNLIALSITVIAVSQVVLSMAKMINKAALNRLIRNLFDKSQGKRVLEVSSSSLLIGQVVGAGVAGLLLAENWIVIGLVVAALSYAGSALFMVLATRGYTEGAEEPASEAATGGTGKAGRRPTIHWTAALISVLVFSVPSSGALQFVTTMLVPLAHDIAPQEPTYYAVLNVVSTVGGFLAGVLLSTNIVTARPVLNWALPMTCVLALALAAAHNRYLVAVVGFLITLIIICHVICMQVLTNRTPRDHEIGQFAVVRNVVASLAKAAFSFAAGVLIGLFGIATTSVVLAMSMAVFSLAWFVAQARAQVFAEEST